MSTTYFVSNERADLDIDVIHGFLTNCYWSPGIPRATVEQAIANSLCFGVFERRPDGSKAQRGFARVISDYTTFAYLCDVFVLEEHRGRGISTVLMSAVMKHPKLQGLRRFALMTRDAHGLYTKFGFKPREDNGKAFMEINDMNAYGCAGRTRC